VAPGCRHATSSPTRSKAARNGTAAFRSVDERSIVAPITMIVVDGSNVIGTVPDGWWRDRAAAARRRLTRLQCLQARTGSELILVLDVVDPELP
jgi:hypothetical protein